MKFTFNLTMSDVWRMLGIVLLAFFYLSPGVGPWLSGARDKVMSDGTDQSTVPYVYSAMLDRLHHQPTDLLYGAVPSANLNPPEGFAVWLTWLEKFVVSAWSPFVVVEQLTTAWAWTLLVLSGISFYLMGIAFGWSRSITFALSLCWAFNAYTRARAKVHIALAGVYHMPLVFLALYLIRERRDRRSLAIAALALLLSAMTAQYYIAITGLLLPFLVVFLFLTPEARAGWRSVLGRSLLAALPALLLLTWTLLKPVPSSFIKPNTITQIKTGDVAPGEIHPFMFRFAAQPVDFFTGEIAIGLNDINPLRWAISKAVVDNIGDGNTHERSNGIRWLIWAAFIYALFHVSSKPLREKIDKPVVSQVIFFSAFALFAIWMSFSPSVFGLNIGPSLWIAKLVSQIRVPSRAGVIGQFGILMVVGTFLHYWLNHKAVAATSGSGKKAKKWQSGTDETSNVGNAKIAKFLRVGGVLPLLVILELPPFLNDMPISNVVPARTALIETDKCGMGLYFPYVSGTWGLLEYYYFLQSMRGSPCPIVNAVTDTVSKRNSLFMQQMPLHPKFMEAIKSNQPEVKARLVHVAQCVPLEWLVFDKQVPEPWADEVCAALGWEMVAKDTCRSREHGRAMAKLPESCLSVGSGQIPQEQ